MVMLNQRMKITLINPRVSDAPSPPLGIMYIAAYLKQRGYQTQIIDACFDINPINKLKAFRPDIIGFSILTSSYNKAAYIRERISQELDYKPFLCAGGIHPTARPEETLLGLNLDWVIVGEGEITMYKAVEAIKNNKPLDNISGICIKSNGRTILTSKPEIIQDLDDLPPLDWDMINLENYLIPPGHIRSRFTRRSLPIIAARGCPFSCIFCSSHLLFGRQVRKPSVNNILDQLEFLEKKYKLEGFYMHDDTFTIDKHWCIEFCRNKLKRKIKLVYGCQSRVDTVDEERLEYLKESGCVQIDYGVESGSDKVLMNLKKGFSASQIRKVFRMTQHKGIRTFATIILGNPGETYEDILLTKKLLREIKPTYTGLAYLVPFPGSEIETMALNNNWINDRSAFLKQEWDIGKLKYPTLEMNFSKEDLYKIRNDIQRTLFLRNFFSFVSMRSILFIVEAFCFTWTTPLATLWTLLNCIRAANLQPFIEYMLYNFRKRKFVN